MKLQTETSDLSILLISLPGALTLINISQESSSFHQSSKALKLFFYPRLSLQKYSCERSGKRKEKSRRTLGTVGLCKIENGEPEKRRGEFNVLELLCELNHMPRIYYSDRPRRLEIGLPVLQQVIPGGQSVRLWVRPDWQRYFQRRPGGTVGKGVPKSGTRPPAGFRL